MPNKPARKIYAKVTNDKFGTKPNQVLSAVDKMVDFIAPTLGPKPKPILVDFGFKTELIDDGVTAAQEFELEDEFEDAVTKYVKEVSERADDKAGDGTTTTMVILRELLHGMIASGQSYPDICKELTIAVGEAVARLTDLTTKVGSEEDLYKVALTSMNDEKIARLIAKVVWETGAKGAVSITDHTAGDTIFERHDGFNMNRGFIARGMMNDKVGQCFTAPNKNFPGPVYVAVIEDLIASQDDIGPILQAADDRDYKNIVIFCNNLIGEAMGIVALSQMKGFFNLVAVQLPGQGDKAKDFVEDLRTLTGAKAPVGLFKAEDFGVCDSIKTTKDDTTVIGGQGDKEDLKALIDHIQAASEETKDPYEKEYLHLRQARLTNGVVLIKVGGVTETEVRLRVKKVEDAINSAKCALEEGVVPGAGVALAKIETSSTILNIALKAVKDQLFTNAEMVDEKHEFGEGETINIITGEFGNFLEVGVVDATKVLRTAIESAVSVAQILFSVSGIINSKRDYGDQKS